MANNCTCSPELEFRKPSNKGPELFIAFAWQCWSLQLWIYLWRQESEQQIEAVYAHGICHYVEPLNEIYSDAIQNNQDEKCQPSGPDMGHALVDPISVGSAKLFECVAVRDRV